MKTNKSRNMTTKKVTIALVLLAGIGIFFSCTKGLDGININPNQNGIATVQPSFLITGTFNNGILDPGMHERMTQLTNDIFAQYYANEGFSTQHGITNDEWIASYWSQYHYPFIAACNQAIRSGRASGHKYNETQIARIWRVWLFSRATDLWGDIPYFQAADGKGTNPPYDKQKLIYEDFMKELKEASDSLSTANPAQLAGQDYVYNDDISKWKKFANSLRLRLAMRISQADPTVAQQNAADAVAQGVFTSSSDAFLVPRGGSFGWGYNYQYTYYYGWGSEVMSRSMENLLTGLGGQPFPTTPPGFSTPQTFVYDDPGIALLNNDENTLDPNANLYKSGVPSVVDPRGPIYYNVSSATSGAGSGVTLTVDAANNITQTVDTRLRWHGVPAGLSNAAAGRAQYSIYNGARLGTAFLQANRPYEVMTYHEVCFLQAEAAQRGWISGGAQTWYEAGITASMLWNGVDNTTIANYISSTAKNTYGTTVSFTNNSGLTYLGKPVDDAMSKIITQKYIAIFPDGGWEAWADHRRLHLPILIPFAGGLDPTRYTVHDGSAANFTRRLTYPGIEALNNKTFYNQAVSEQGADSETTPVWWDQN
ncbi:MAG: SusD/RagB family nutrient-binding outer membrane lipoprotein [Bacteroidetes bacterium]|nr:SusD/RagB family nutrient-binding outer membrane lipoprotein [Bacteroidota bacterium]MBS1541507.1 SusD/RagB family nutrient-binding outer membrane lipoprotein [Bacteroidota bacterium]